MMGEVRNCCVEIKKEKPAFISNLLDYKAGFWNVKKSFCTVCRKKIHLPKATYVPEINDPVPFFHPARIKISTQRALVYVFSNVVSIRGKTNHELGSSIRILITKNLVLCLGIGIRINSELF